MCGICGVVRRQGPVAAQDIVAMRDRMLHRGPDDAGVYTADGVGLGHRRLSIIDLSPAGHQPMANEDGTLWVVFNGEIYNYLELAGELEAAGHRFVSHCDTEVILHAFEEWGAACLDRFVGMFAFALWDTRRRSLFLARDHLGVKPLYYHYGGGDLVFGSEIKAILEARPACARPRPEALYDFLTLTRFEHDHTTLFAGIDQLQPGCFMRFRPDEGRPPRQVRYWRGTPADALAKWDYSRPVEKLGELFEESVGLQLRSDVPLGAFLSGGLDSSGIVGVASGRTPGPIQTFSVAYEGAQYDERRFIDACIEAFPVTHKRVMPGPEKMAADFERFTRHQETPTNGPGPFSEWCVSELAASDVTVLLSGQGPDEMLGGYMHYFGPYVETRVRRWLAQPRLDELPGLWREAGAIAAMTGRPALFYLLASLVPGRERAINRVKRRLRRRELTADFAWYGRDVPLQPDAEPPGPTPLDRRLADTVTGWGLARLLHYADRNTMAFSLEARVPFLDHRLVEYCMGLPYDYKIRGTVTKYALRQALRPRLPRAIVERTDKKGFPSPVAQWLRANEDFVRARLDAASVRRRGLLRWSAVDKRLEAHMAGRRDHGWILWQWLSVEQWFREFID